MDRKPPLRASTLVEKESRNPGVSEVLQRQLLRVNGESRKTPAKPVPQNRFSCLFYEFTVVPKSSNWNVTYFEVYIQLLSALQHGLQYNF